MINLVAHHKHIVGENPCGCSNRKMEYLGAFLEVILVVGAIVALAIAGGWGSLSNVERFVVILAGCVLLVDIIRALVKHHYISAIEARKAKLAATGITLHSTLNGNFINLKPLFPQSTRSHVYPVYTTLEAHTRRDSMKDGEFFFHFRGDPSTDLIDVLCTFKSPGANPATVNDCFDGEPTLRELFESGALKRFGRDHRLQEFIELNAKKEMRFREGGQGRTFAVKDKATASAAQNTLQANECFLFWALPDDQSLSNISCMTKDRIFPEWFDNEDLREPIKSGRMAVK